MSEEQIINEPTIGDFIKKLQEYPLNTPLRILDADTSWIIDRIHLKINDDKLFLSGEYYEMLNRSLRS